MTEAEKRMHRVCFTGHRPEKLTRSDIVIRRDLEKEIRQAVADGLNVFITGMARGVDIWAAQIVLMLRDEGCDVKLMCACPYEGFERSWSQDWQNQYREILASADLVKYVCGGYSRSCFQIRNEWMVNHAARVIAVFNGEKSGTKNTIDYGFVINRTFSLVAAVAPQLRKKKFLQIIDKENLFLENRMFSRTVLDHILVSEDGILEFVLKNGYRVTVDSKNIILDDIEESAEEIDIEDVYMDIPEEEVSILTSIPKISKKATPRSERLTEDEKKTIIDLRLAGNTFSLIAETLVRNINTVKVFYFRNQYNPKYVENVKPKAGCCLQCGNPITEISKHRPRKFCSHSCKDLWWRAHKKPIYTFSCAHCGKTFGTASKTQKYCSTDCFHASRKKG